MFINECVYKNSEKINKNCEYHKINEYICKNGFENFLTKLKVLLINKFLFFSSLNTF